MPFVVPQFPLGVNIWRVGGAGGIYAIPNVITVGNLSPGRRVMLGIIPVAGSAQTLGPTMELLLPAGTDVRADWNGADEDLVECPSGSKRFYSVRWVDDIGKGFANEHRFCVMYYRKSGDVNLIGGPFPAPVPLP